MSYTIEIRTLPTLGSEIVGRFTGSAWNLLWQNCKSTKNNGKIGTLHGLTSPLPELPEISKLA